MRFEQDKARLRRGPTGCSTVCVPHDTLQSYNDRLVCKRSGLAASGPSQGVQPTQPPLRMDPVLSRFQQPRRLQENRGLNTAVELLQRSAVTPPISIHCGAAKAPRDGWPMMFLLACSLSVSPSAISGRFSSSLPPMFARRRCTSVFMPPPRPFGANRSRRLRGQE